MQHLLSLEDVRNNINQLDEQIIQLIAERYQCVKLAASFKKDQAHVADIARVQQVINKVKLLANAYDLPDVVAESVYTVMIKIFIELEQDEFNKLNEQNF